MIKTLANKMKAWAFLVKEKGSVAMEFALTLPIWITILLGSSDAALLMLLSQRVDRIAYSVTDIVSQSETISIADLDQILLAAGQLMQPFTFGADGMVIITSAYRPSGGTTKISWQYSGGGTLTRTSRLGSASAPTLPNGLTLNENENVIIAEVFYDYEPMFINAGIFSKRDLYRVAVYKPRLSPLITPPT